MEDLVNKARHGDDQAFYELISQNRRRLYGTALQYLRDEAQALEAVQEVTCRAYLKLYKLKNPEYFSTWLIRIMINYCLDELKRHKRTVPLEDWDVPDADELDGHETRMDLQICVGKLKPKYRDVLVFSRVGKDNSNQELKRGRNGGGSSEDWTYAEYDYEYSSDKPIQGPVSFEISDYPNRIEKAFEVQILP